MAKGERLNVRTTVESKAIFRAVAQRLGLDEDMSAAIHVVMFDRARDLGILPPLVSPRARAGHPPGKQKKEKRGNQ